MKFRRRLSDDIAALIEALQSEGRANRGEESREDRGKRLREWLTMALLALTLCAVLWQVHEMIKVYGPIKEQADALQVAAKAQTTSAQAESTAAEAAKEQADEADKAFTLGQRAWVGPVNATFAAEPAIGKPIDIAIQYENSGRQPALGFVEQVNVVPAVLNRAVSPRVATFMTDCRDANPSQGGQVIYPTANFTINYTTEKTVVDRNVLSGRKIVIVQGCFHYVTMGAPKYSYFCYFYRHGQTKIQNLTVCVSGHDAD